MLEYICTPSCMDDMMVDDRWATSERRPVRKIVYMYIVSTSLESARETFLSQFSPVLVLLAVFLIMTQFRF
jgi:hypothetical protein